jgi:hypothetical protein
MKRITIDKELGAPHRHHGHPRRHARFPLRFRSAPTPWTKRMKSDRILNLAVVIEKEGKPVSTQLFLFYPSNGRGALLDVPGETGLIIKSLNRVDRIDVLYDKRRPKAYTSTR